jgi:hypothetical protein
MQQRKRLECHLQRHYRKHGLKGGIIVMDFHGFFESIRHSLILHILNKNYEDKRIIGFNMKIIRTYRKDVGLILGSENSQDFAISAPNYLDHYIKEVLHFKESARFMDDSYAMHEDWNLVKKAFGAIKKVAEAMGFKLNEKKCRIIPFGKPFRFLKTLYRMTNSGKIIKTPHRDSVIRERKKIKKFHKKFLQGKMKLATILQSINSWKSSIAHTKCRKVVRSIEKLYNELFIKPFIEGSERREAYVLQTD